MGRRGTEVVAGGRGRQVCGPRSLDGCEAAESLDNKDSLLSGLVERLVKHQKPSGRQYSKSN